MAIKNALLEAAADILNQSKSSAPRMEMEKSAQGFQDLGGVTPQKSASNKIEVGASQATPPGKQPSSDTKAPMLAVKNGTEIDPHDAGEPASEEENERKARIAAGLAKADLTEEKDDDDDKDGKKDEDEDEDDKEEKKKMDEAWKKELKEDVAAILKSETSLPAEFATKIGTIYEVRVTDKVQSITEEIVSEYNTMFEEAVIEVRDALTEQVNDYLSYVVEEWMKQNELAIEKGLRSELTEDFVSGMRDLFQQHYIDIPSEKVDLVNELATKVEDLTAALNESVAKSVELKKQLGESKKIEIVNGICEGLTQTQVEKVRTLAESVEFTAEGDYTSKVTTIRENYFPITTGRKTDTNAKMLTEVSEQMTEEKAAVDSDVASVVASLAKSLK